MKRAQNPAKSIRTSRVVALGDEELSVVSGGTVAQCVGIAVSGASSLLKSAFGAVVAGADAVNTATHPLW